MARVVDGIKDLLVTAGVGTFAATTGWGLFIGIMPDTPDTALAINQTGGQSRSPRWRINYPSVQVMVRGRADDYRGAYDKAEEVMDNLVGIPSQDLNGDRWVAINAIGDVNWLGRDEKDRPMFSVNLSLIIEPASSVNRDAL